ncbi:MAG: FtsW/RodA/SpoVE family cell cycle protein, partial [Acidobacteriota bacterium]|nr:FtsW/RodA/SpoVE family cell cycle protein [Acidobacteriota bacterium]
MMSASEALPVVVYRKQRNAELGLCLLASLFGIGGYLITHLNRGDVLSITSLLICAGWVALCI